MSLFFNVSPAYFAQAVLAYLVSYSLRFDKADLDYLTQSNQVTATDSDKWTLSVWIKSASDSNSTFRTIISGGENNAPLYLGLDDKLHFYEYNGTSVQLQFNTNETIKVADGWTHVVMSVDYASTSTFGDKVKVWIDGTPATLSTDSGGTDPGAGAWNLQGGNASALNGTTYTQWSTYPYRYIGRKTNSLGRYFDGEMAEFHFIDGQFLDPTYFGETRNGVWVPKEVTDIDYGNNGFYLDFKGNDTGVTLLLDGTSTADKSSAGNNFSLYGNAAAKDTGVSDPYGGTKGSFLFDGSGDALTSTNGDIIGISNPFTVEFWVRHDTLSLQNYLDIFGSNVGWTYGGNSVSLLISATQMQLQWWDGASGNNKILQNHGMSVDTWHHVALVYDGTGMTLYVDGSSIGSLAGTTTDGGSSQTYFGIYRDLSSYPLDGRMHDIRITKGYARYTGSFTPPISSLTNTPEYLGDFGADRSTDGTGVTLLLDGSSLTDASGAGNDFINSGATLNATPSPDHPYAVEPVAFDFPTGAGTATTQEYLYSSAGAFDDMDNGDPFTIEFWAKADALGSATTYRGLFGIGGYNTSTGLTIRTAGTTLAWWVGGANYTVNHQVALNTTDWFHIALVYDGSVSTLFINGVPSSSTSSRAPSFGTNAVAVIGRNYGASVGYHWNGQITDVRVTRGVARYSDTFTPPTSALTNDDTWDKPKNNFSVEGNITPDDQLLDTPNLRFASFDPDNADAALTFSDANLTLDASNTSWPSTLSTHLVGPNDKVYFEWSGDLPDYGIGLMGLTDALPSSTGGSYIGSTSTSYGVFFTSNGDMRAYTNATLKQISALGLAPASPNVLMCAIDRPNGEIHFGFNGVWRNFNGSYITSNNPDIPVYTGIATTGDYYVGGSAYYFNAAIIYDFTANFGQDHTFAGLLSPLVTPYSDANGVGEFYYQPPSGFLALATEYK